MLTQLLIVAAAVFLAISVVFPFFHKDKVRTYVKKRGGKVISIDASGLTDRNKGTTIFITYHDKYQNTRRLTLIYFGPFSTFDTDEIIEYDHGSPEYLELKQKEIKAEEEREKKLVSAEERSYTLENYEVLSVKQEYENPNVGEYVFLNTKPAPDGKYKIGFMKYVYVENGRIISIEMS